MDNIEAGIMRVHREAAGVLAVEVVRYSDIPPLLFAAAGGDASAERTIGILGGFLDGVGRARRGNSILCATCRHALKRSKFACVIVRPFRDDRSEGLCLGVCARCVPHGSVADIEAKGLAFLKRVWPESRILDPGQIHVDRGHA